MTARTEERTSAIDQEFLQLVEWIREGLAPIEAPSVRLCSPAGEAWLARSVPDLYRVCVGMAWAWRRSDLGALPAPQGVRVGW